MSQWLDSLLNLMVFVFVGLLFWLYFKPDSMDDEEDETSES